MKKTRKPMIRTTTEFIILPPCGDRITYEISMNSPHPVLFFDALSPPLILNDPIIFQWFFMSNNKSGNFQKPFFAPLITHLLTLSAAGVGGQSAMTHYTDFPLFSIHFYSVLSRIFGLFQKSFKTTQLALADFDLYLIQNLSHFPLRNSKIL